MADKHVAFAQTCQNVQSEDKILAVCLDDRHGIGRQRVRVHGGDENRMRAGLRWRNLVEGAGPQCGPEARFHQILTGLVAAEGRHVVCVELFRLVAFQFNNDRFELPLRPTIDGHDRAAAGRGVSHARSPLVGEQQLPQLDEIPFAHSHRGFHADIIVAHQGHSVWMGPGGDLLDGGPADRYVQAFFDACHGVFHQVPNDTRPETIRKRTLPDRGRVL